MGASTDGWVLLEERLQRGRGMLLSANSSVHLVVYRQLL